MPNNQLQLEVVVDHDGAIKAYQLVEAQGKKTAASAKESFEQSGSAADKFTEKVKASGAAVRDAFREYKPEIIAAGVAIAEHAGTVDKMVNVYRGLRLALSPTVFTGVTIAAGIAAEAIVKMTIAEAKLIEQQSLLAAKSGLAVETIQQLSFSANRSGVEVGVLTQAYSKLEKALSGGAKNSTLDELGVSYRNLTGTVKDSQSVFGDLGRAFQAVPDPTDKARLAVALFGEEIGGKVLPHLNERLSDNQKRFQDWSLEIDKNTRVAVSSLRDDIRDLKEGFYGLEDSAAAAGRAMKQAIVGNVATGYQGLKYTAPAAASILEYYTGIPAVMPPSGDRIDRDFGVAASSVMSKKAGALPDIATQVFGDTARTTVDKFSNSIDGLSRKLGELQSRRDLLLRAVDSGGPLGAMAGGALPGVLSDINRTKSRIEALNTRPVEQRSTPLSSYIKILDGINTFHAKLADEAAALGVDELKTSQVISGELARTAGFGTPETGLIAAMRLVNMGKDSLLPDNNRIPLSGDELFALQHAGMEHSNRMYDIGSGANPATSAQHEYALQLQLASQESDIAKNKLDLARAGYEYEEKIAEIRKSSEEQFRSLAGGLFDAALGGSNGIRSFFIGQAQSIGRTATENAAGMIFHPGITSLPSSLIGTADNPNFLGKLLKGTAIGGDPATIQMSAAQLQFKAATLFAGAVTGTGVGSIPGVASIPGIGTFGSDVNGLTGGVLNWGGSNTGIFGTPFGGTSNSSTPGMMSRFMTGFGAPDLRSLYGGDYSIQTGDGTATTASSLGTAGQIGAGVATAGVIAGGAYGVYSGIKTGGARGTLGAIGSATGAAATLDPEPISKAILAGIAAASGIATMFFGDPKQNRATQIAHQLHNAHFYDPVALNVSEGFSGGLSDYDRNGNVRSSSLSPFPTVEQSYIDYRHNITVPGRTLGTFGGQTNITINAMDQASFSAYMKANSNAVVDATIHGIESQGRTDLIEKIRPLM